MTYRSNETSGASVPESEWIGGCPVYARARSPQECEKCGGDLLKCPVYGEGERRRQAKDAASGASRLPTAVDFIGYARLMNGVCAFCGTIRAHDGSPRCACYADLSPLGGGKNPEADRG